MTFTAESDALLRDASDADVLDAYRESGGEIGNPAAEGLLGEIRDRNPLVQSVFAPSREQPIGMSSITEVRDDRRRLALLPEGGQ